MPDPKTLSDEELDAAIAGEEPKPESNPSEPESPETPEPETPEPEAPETPEEPEETPPVEPETPPEEQEEKPPSRRETLRIQQVLERVRKQQQPQPTPSSREGAFDYSDLDADPELIRALEEDRSRAESDRYEEGLKQANAIEWRTMLHIDSPRVEAKYPHLDKNSPEYHQAITEAMYGKYLDFVGYDPNTNTVTRPNVRFFDFVDGEYELADEIASLKTKDTAKNISKQANQTGLRPNGGTSKRLNLNQNPENMSDEELDAVIAQAIPKR